MCFFNEVFKSFKKIFCINIYKKNLPIVQSLCAIFHNLIQQKSRQGHVLPKALVHQCFSERAGMFTFLGRKEEQRIPFHICTWFSSIMVAAL